MEEIRSFNINVELCKGLVVSLVLNGKKEIVKDSFT